MASTPEAKAKAKVRKHLDAAGAYYVMSVTGGYGKSGAPDITGCHKGQYFGIEVKADTEVTALQQQNLDMIKAAGGYPFVVRRRKDGTEEGFDELIAFLEGAKQC